MYADKLATHISTPFSAVEERYQKAKARLASAQQEKVEATLEFLAARAVLSRWMGEVWPERESERPAVRPGLSFDVQPTFGSEVGIIKS